MIQAKDLVKVYGKKIAVNHVSFSVSKGEIIGFLGENGAGKSTTMRLLTGFISPTSGSVKICGKDMEEEPEQAKRYIGYLPEEPPLYLDMTAGEQLEFVCRVRGIKKKEIPLEIKRVCGLTQLDGIEKRMLCNVSKGFRQRLGLAQALIASPDVLLLDEPMVGLDPSQVIQMRNLIASLAKEHTIFFSSHMLSEVSAVCSRVMVIHEGRLVADGTPEKLCINMNQEKHFFVRICGKRQDIERAIFSVTSLTEIKYAGEKESGSHDYLITAKEGMECRLELFYALSKENCPILFLQEKTASLEDLFLHITKIKEGRDV